MDFLNGCSSITVNTLQKLAVTTTIKKEDPPTPVSLGLVLQSCSPTPPSPATAPLLFCPILYHRGFICSKCHVSGIIQPVIFGDQMFSLSKMPLRFIQVVRINNLFLFCFWIVFHGIDAALTLFNPVLSNYCTIEAVTLGVKDFV